MTSVLEYFWVDQLHLILILSFLVCVTFISIKDWLSTIGDKYSYEEVRLDIISSRPAKLRIRHADEEIGTWDAELIDVEWKYGEGEELVAVIAGPEWETVVAKGYII